jgi:hypothetical protein
VDDVDQVLVVVVIHGVEMGVRFGLCAGRGTFWRLLSVVRIALINIVEVWMYFSFCYFLSGCEKLLQMCTPSLSDRIIPRRSWNYYNTRRSNSAL